MAFEVEQRDILAKIGSLVIELEVAYAENARLRARVAELEQDQKDAKAEAEERDARVTLGAEPVIGEVPD